MKLYFFPRSPNSRKVWATAVALNIDLELQLVDLLAGKQKDPEYLKLNPNGLTPRFRTATSCSGNPTR